MVDLRVALMVAKSDDLPAANLADSRVDHLAVDSAHLKDFPMVEWLAACSAHHSVDYLADARVATLDDMMVMSSAALWEHQAAEKMVEKKAAMTVEHLVAVTDYLKVVQKVEPKDEQMVE
jgi:hypothetical protein